jgi:adenine deaminase
MRVAANVMRSQGIDVEPRMLVEMVTSTAAEVAGPGEHLGTLEPDRPADLVVLGRLADDAYESVQLAAPHDVDMVMIGGDVTYARQEWIDQIAAHQPSPPASGHRLGQADAPRQRLPEPSRRGRCAHPRRSACRPAQGLPPPRAHLGLTTSTA